MATKENREFLVIPLERVSSAAEERVAILKKTLVSLSPWKAFDTVRVVCQLYTQGTAPRIDVQPFTVSIVMADFSGTCNL